MAEIHSSSVYHFSINNKALFLHPFRDQKYFLGLEKEHIVTGYYGNAFDYKVLPVFRDELELLLQAHLKAWNEERTFIVSFLLSSLSFLLVFIFLSIGIHDPIPLVDELLIAIAIAVATFIGITRKMFKSATVTERKKAIQSSFDAMSFSQLPVLKEADRILREYEQIVENGSEAIIMKLITEPDTKHDFTALKKEVALLKSLEIFFSNKRFRSFQKSPDKLISFLRQEWYHISELKLPLYLLYIQLTK